MMEKYTFETLIVAMEAVGGRDYLLSYEEHYFHLNCANRGNLIWETSKSSKSHVHRVFECHGSPILIVSALLRFA